MASQAGAQGRQDGAEILQLLINARELAQYFHFDTHPQRAPLRIVNRSGLDLGAPALSSGGHAATLTAEGGERPLEIRSVEIRDDAAEIRFAFPAEGVSGRGSFVRQGGSWAVKAVVANEH